MNKMDEMIIVAPRKDIFENEELAFQGTLQDQEKVDQILNHVDETYSIMRRGDAEENKDFKQPIPYALIKRGEEVFIYERLQGAGETRLHNKTSLGVGGHMNEVKKAKTFDEVLSTNLNRELEEELILSKKPIKITPIGLINDDSDEVGEVHLCVLTVIEVSEDTTVEVRETEELRGKFFPIEKLKLKQYYSSLENWSKIAVDIL